MEVGLHGSISTDSFAFCFAERREEAEVEPIVVEYANDDVISARSWDWDWDWACGSDLRRDRERTHHSWHRCAERRRYQKN